MKRIASAVWTGDFKEGSGTLSSTSKVLNETPYSFSTRFENAIGTNPEELIAAAHAGCFTMALSAFLSKEGFIANKLKTLATLTMEQINGNWTISAVALELTADVNNITKEKLEEIAQNAKKNCPVSRVLNADISLKVN